VAISSGPVGSLPCAVPLLLALFLELGLVVVEAVAALADSVEEPSRSRGGNDDDDVDDSVKDEAVEAEAADEEAVGLGDGGVVCAETRIPFCTMMSSAPSIRRVSKFRKCKEPETNSGQHDRKIQKLDRRVMTRIHVARGAMCADNLHRYLRIPWLRYRVDNSGSRVPVEPYLVAPTMKSRSTHRRVCSAREL
jgi:hypothetical protein